jgi:hypothetical protein
LAQAIVHADTVKARIANNTDYGFAIDTEYYNFLVNWGYERLKYGGLPHVFFDAEAVNHNIIASSNNLALSAPWFLQGSCTLTGNNTLNCDADNKGIAQSITTGGHVSETLTLSADISGNGTFTLEIRSGSAGNSYKKVVTLTGTKQRFKFAQAMAVSDTDTTITIFFRRYSGNTATTATVENADCRRGNWESLSYNYHPRTGTTSVRVPNIGTASIADTAFTNGTSISMVSEASTLATSRGRRRIFKSVATSTQRLVTAFNSVAGASADMQKAFGSRASNTGGALGGYQASGTNRRLLWSYNAGDLSYSTDSGGPANITAPAPNIWHSHIAQYNGTSAMHFLNAGSKQSTDIALNNTATPIEFLGVGVTGLHWDGLANFLEYTQRSLTDAQILAIHNYEKQFVGL